MNRRILLSLAGGLLLAAGCKHKCCRSGGDGLPPAAPFLPPGPGSTIPPAGVPITPGPTGGALPPPDLRPSTSGRPAPEILLPDPIGPGGTSSQKKPKGDSILGGPIAGPGSSKTGTLEPPIALKPETAPATTGVIGFQEIGDGIFAGRKPAVDGFDGLKKNGAKTIIFLHAPGTDVASVREMVETRGLTLTAIETTPEKLKDASEAFQKAVAEKTARPAYVFDDDGTRVGAITYLYCKQVKLENRDVSKITAKGVGLTNESEFWAAIKEIAGE
jgi:protein tyrosine phosphatase (PTP) superfamily phosphohydrolase (DUF442 family)